MTKRQSLATFEFLSAYDIWISQLPCLPENLEKDIEEAIYAAWAYLIEEQDPAERIEEDEK